MTTDAYATFACGALAGAIAATLTTPADVAKTFRQIELGQRKVLTSQDTISNDSIKATQKQFHTRSTFAVLSHVLRVEGPKSLFAGKQNSSI